MKVHPDLVDLVCCPKCHRGLTLLADESAFTCAACSLSYPVVEGVPVLLLDEARPLPAPPIPPVI